MITNQVTLVIPAYNEARTIREVVRKALQYVEKIIVIDDGSNDGTSEQIKDLSIILIKHEKNLGKAASLFNGFRYSQKTNASGVITLDADGQHNPEDIPKFITKIAQDPEKIIIGARLLHTENAPKYRLIGNKMSDFFISWAAGTKIIDSQSGFRYYPPRLIKYCLQTLAKSESFVFEGEILIKATDLGFSLEFLPIVSSYPKDRRKSHFKPLRDSFKISHMICSNLLAHGFNIKFLTSKFFKK